MAPSRTSRNASQRRPSIGDEKEKGRKASIGASLVKWSLLRCSVSVPERVPCNFSKIGHFGPESSEFGHAPPDMALWPGIDLNLLDFVQFWLVFGQICPNISQHWPGIGKISRELAGTRPNLALVRPKLLRNRATAAGIRRPGFSHCDLKLTKFDQNWAGNDQVRLALDQNWTDFRQIGALGEAER